VRANQIDTPAKQAQSDALALMNEDARKTKRSRRCP
jgi:hypothetical protein